MSQLTQTISGAPFTIPPQQFPPEVLTELADNCHAPLFLESELSEWADIFQAHEALVSSSQPTCDNLIFDGLTAHPITNPLLDGPLFCLQTRVKVVHTQTTPQVQRFNFAPGQWVAVWADADEDTQDFWICKIISVLHKRLHVHWWNLLMDAGLTMAQRALFQWGLFWLVALTLTPTLEFPQPPFKKYLDTCK
ncbi:hypothetical protein DB41_CA00010 [Neochlamydia sp. TUME1]|nr:hypothetical protein DB41_CA00010 [Neochlamydia sp. TUME1]